MMSAGDEVIVAPLRTAAHYQECEALQQAVWQSGPLEVVPAHVLITAQRHGGLVLGAFAGERMVGCLFGFPGRVAPDNLAAAGARWQHCSHLVGVHPEWQGRGVGLLLKAAQRDWALREGYDLITWTYDPLRLPNAVLNLGKLGAVCRCYLRDFYEGMIEGINLGLPTDRFEVAWWVASPRVRERLERGWQRPALEEVRQRGAVVLNAGLVGSDGWVEPGPLEEPAGPVLLLEFPAHLDPLRAARPDLALAWRLSVRRAAEAAFAAGYSAGDVVRAQVDGVPRAYYLLERIVG